MLKKITSQDQPVVEPDTDKKLSEMRGTAQAEYQNRFRGARRKKISQDQSSILAINRGE